MTKTLIYLFLIQFPLINFGQIIDHRCIALKSIPTHWVDVARSNLHIAYQHTSHGSQIIDGMTGLFNWKGSQFVWNEGGTDGALDIDDYAVELSGSYDIGNYKDTPNYTEWATSTRTYLNDPANSDINVVMWSWCGEVSGASITNINIYLSLMTELEKDYPHVKFIYMTGHLDGTGVNNSNLHDRNEQIRSYCRNNNKILYDFADIESYDPDGIYYEDKLATDACNYDYNNNGTTTQTGDPATPTNGDRNWAVDWQNSHIKNIDWFECTVAHSSPLNGNLKAYAAWWLWARLAGWDGGITSASLIENDNGKNCSVIVTIKKQEMLVNVPDHFLFAKLRIYNLQGSLITAMNIDGNTSSINISDFSSGMYILVLSRSSLQIIKKIIIVSIRSTTG